MKTARIISAIVVICFIAFMFALPLTTRTTCASTHIPDDQNVPSQIPSFDVTIGSSVDVTLSGGALSGTLYGYNLTDPLGYTTDSGFIARDASGNAEKTFDFPNNASQGTYSIDYWVIDTLEEFVAEIEAIPPTGVNSHEDNLILGAPFEVIFGLIDLNSNPVEVNTFEFWLRDPSGSIIQSGNVVSTNGVNATVVLNLDSESLSGNYRLDYRPIGSSYSVLMITIPARALLAPVVTVSIPSSPQLGTWIIGVNIYNRESTTIDAEISILLDGNVIVTQDVELQPGDNLLTYYPAMADLTAGGRFAAIQVLLRFGSDTTPTPLYQGTVLITSAWQIPILIILVPGLVVAVPITELIRRGRIRKAEEVVRAKKLEDGDEDDKTQAFDLYRRSGFRNSAIRMAIALGLSEAMIEGIMKMGSHAKEPMTKVARAYDSRGDFETASRVYRHLNLEVDYRRTSILSEIRKGNLESAAAQFVKLAESEYSESAVKLIVNLHDQEMADEALSLCLQLGEGIRKLTRHITPNPHSVEVFSYLASAFDDDSTRLNFLCDIGSSDEAASMISTSKTLNNIVDMTNLVEIKYRNDVIQLVIAKLAAKGLFKRMKAYVDALKLSDADQAMIITPIAEELLNNPDNKNLKQFLKDAAKTAAPDTKTFINDVLDASDILSGFGGTMDMEISLPYIEALLRSVERIKNLQLASQLLEKVHSAFMGEKKIAELSMEDLAQYSQYLRATTYGATEKVSDMLKKQMQPLEDNLRNRIKTAAKDVVKDLPLDPEEDMKLVTSSNFLTRHLVEDLPQQNPTVMAQTLHDLTKIPMFPQLRAVLDKALNNENFIRFALKVLANPELRMKLIMASQKYERIYGGYRVTIDQAQMTRITRDLAIKVWTERIHNVWIAGLYGALDTVVFNSMTRNDVPTRQKMLLTAAYINRLNYAPDIMEDVNLKETYKRICDAAGFSKEERSDVLTLSKLPGHISARIRY
ncbi:MAG: tetratricopeptide repeat protein [Candidatus Thorarchaeota archaeon]